MMSLVVYFILSCFLLWLLVMLVLWRKEIGPHEDVMEEIKPLVNKSRRGLRKAWFLILRKIKKVRAFLTVIIIKVFFMIFPNARKAFEKKDLSEKEDQGPASDFLISISEDFPVKDKKGRRKQKNV